MKKAHNKVLTVILTAMLLIGALPLAVGANEIYQDLYIPNTETRDFGDINHTEEITIPNNNVIFRQTVATNRYNTIIFEGMVGSISITPDDEGLLATPTDQVVTVAFAGNYKRYNGEELYDEYPFALMGVFKTIVKKINPNDPFNTLDVASYAILIFDGDSGSLIDGFYDRNLFDKLTIEQQLLNKSLDTNGLKFAIEIDSYENLTEVERIIFDYMFITYKPLFDQYTFKDYLHYENEIISSAQTGITEWTTNPTVFLVICIIMGVVLTYILLTSLKEWCLGRRY